MGKDFYDGCWMDQYWRLNHLYHIQTKENGVQRFRMNPQQEKLYRNLHTKNTILKARQLGMSTFSSIFILDECLFKPNTECGWIDKGIEDAREKIQKIRLAVECMENPPNTTLDHVEDEEDRHSIAMWSKGLLTEAVKANIQAERADFSNGSSVRIGTSLRGGTLRILVVSELGHVANTNPQKAVEIISGGLNAVPKNGLVIMESTHEGARTGENYRLLKAAMDNQGNELSAEDYRFFFFPWYEDATYRIDSDNAPDKAFNDYFKQMQKRGIELDDGQKRWYISKAKVLGFRMKTEYPTTPEEAFMAQVQGSIYGEQIMRLRSQGRMCVDFAESPYAPLYVSWDVGMSDYTAMWLIQVGADGLYYVLDYFCANKQGIPFYIKKCAEWEKQFGQSIKCHLLPHDMAQPEFGKKMPRHYVFSEAGLRWNLVKRTNSVWDSIFLVRDALARCVFHARCDKSIVIDGVEYMSGVEALENYQTGPVGSNGVERNEPLHNACSHGADAFRMFVEGLSGGLVSKESITPVDDFLFPDPPRRRRRKKRKEDELPSYW